MHPLPKPEAKAFRAAAARLNYLSLDRCDLTYAAKEVSRAMSAPTFADAFRLKRVVRYLQGHPHAEQVFRWQTRPRRLVAETDSDWAGCQRTRRSTSGGVLYHGQHMLLHWSRTQSVIALSSCEAELNAALKASCELMGIHTLLEEWGRPLELVLRGDSSACKGVLHREGLGKLKHLHIKQLWLQREVGEGRICFEKVPRAINTADTLTKHWTPDAHTLFHRMGFYC